MCLPESKGGLPSQGKGDGRIHKIIYFMKFASEMTTGNAVVSEIDALMYVITKHG